MKTRTKFLSYDRPDKCKSVQRGEYKAETQLKKFLAIKHQKTDPRLPEITTPIKNSQSIREFISKDKKRLPSLRDSWTNSRDISHLKDKRGSLPNQSILALPTDITTLKNRKNSVSPKKNSV